ncbi:MAG: metal-sensing transcriptional repressor [Clostridiales bacterium]|nr:metal-sensing transcriptional repressor [Clostridiales bacterium]
MLNQIAAVQSAINSVSKLLLENHLRTCVVTKIKNDESEVIDELIKTIGKIL